MPEIKLISSNTGYQIHLHLALDEAVSDYEKVHEKVTQRRSATDDTATLRLMVLDNALEQKRVTVLLLAAACVEAVANLYLGFKATPRQFKLLERATFLEKWTVVPSLFLSGYEFPKGGELYQDLKRLHTRRNALVHFKEEVHRDGGVFHPGSSPQTAADEHLFVSRCRTLPDKLVKHLASFDKSDALGPIYAILTLAATYSRCTTE